VTAAASKCSQAGSASFVVAKRSAKRRANSALTLPAQLARQAASKAGGARKAASAFLTRFRAAFKGQRAKGVEAVVDQNRQSRRSYWRPPPLPSSSSASSSRGGVVAKKSPRANGGKDKGSTLREEQTQRAAALKKKTVEAKKAAEAEKAAEAKKSSRAQEGH